MRRLAVLALLVLPVTAQHFDKPFATSISGEGGPPIRDTPVGTPGTSDMNLFGADDEWLRKYPLVRRERRAGRLLLLRSSGAVPFRCD